MIHSSYGHLMDVAQLLNHKLSINFSIGRIELNLEHVDERITVGHDPSMS